MLLKFTTQQFEPVATQCNRCSTTECHNPNQPISNPVSKLAVSKMIRENGDHPGYQVLLAVFDARNVKTSYTTNRGNSTRSYMEALTIGDGNVQSII